MADDASHRSNKSEEKGRKTEREERQWVQFSSTEFIDLGRDVPEGSWICKN